MTSSELCAYLRERRSVYRSLAELKKEKPIKEQDRESNKEKEEGNITKEKERLRKFSPTRATPTPTILKNSIFRG